MNSVVLIGNLGADPELRFTPRGQKVANLRLAVEDRQRIEGEWSSTTDWFSVVAWGRLADVAESLAKGDRIVVAGRLKTRSWDDATTGKRRTVVEVVASTLGLEPSVRGSTSGSGSHGATPPQSHGRSSSPATPPLQAPADGADYFDDDVPF